MRDWLGLVVLLALAVTHAAQYAWYTIDDAYITFRYARHLAGGVGAVFNPGTYVKGYSNTLFMWLSVVPEWLEWSTAYFAKLVGFAALLALVTIAYAECRRLYGSFAAALGAPALIVASTSMALWYVAGLETGLYTTLVFAAVNSRLRESETDGRPYSAVLFAAAAISRPEGIIFFVAMALHGLLFHRHRAGLRNLVWHLVPLATFSAELLVSKVYYGAALASTFYAKVDHEGTAVGSLAYVATETMAQLLAANSYVAAGLAPFGGRATLLLALVAFLASTHRSRHLAYLLCVGAQVAFIARVRGDWMAGYRFLVPALPFLFMLVTGAYDALAQRTFVRHARVASQLALIAFVAFCVVGNLDLGARLKQPSVDAAGQLALGAKFGALLPSGATFASFDVGGEGYAAPELEVIDLASLTDDLTYGCYAKPRRCAGYARALAPELVRRHPGRKADYFYRELLKTGDYVELGRQRYLVRRDLLVAARTPSWANGQVAASDPSGPSGTNIVATELPRHVRPNERLQAVLYWNLAEPRTLPAADRSLAFVRGAQSTDAQATDPWWSALGAPADALGEAQIVDRLKFSAPAQPGVYEVVLRGHGVPATRVGSIEVIGDQMRIAKFAKQLVADSEAAQTEAAGDAALRRAVALDGYTPARKLYERVVIARARHFMERARGKKSVAALRDLDRARGLLHRAYADLGHASSALRRSIDAVGKARRAAILGALRRTAS